MWFRLPVYVLAVVVMAGCVASKTSTGSRAKAVKPKNVILLIGDGMGLSQISLYNYTHHNATVFERFQSIGLIKTHAHRDLITDSAASATAYGCGVKSYNAAIGVDADTVPVPNLIELAKQKGLAAGLVATSTITHATPACFIAHNRDRNNHEEIATDFLKTPVDIFIGGGLRYFENRADERNLSAELRQMGYYVSDYVKEPLEMMILPNQPVAYFTAYKDPLPANDGRDYLPIASLMALDFLKGRSAKGFFAMLEGSQIDWAGHDNNPGYMLGEMEDFGKTIEAVLDWAARDGETLVIVTADHETGGLALAHNENWPADTAPQIPETSRYYNNSKVQDSIYNTIWHTATMVPVFAFGPGSEQFTGVFDNTAVFSKIRALLQI